MDTKAHASLHIRENVTFEESFTFNFGRDFQLRIILAYRTMVFRFNYFQREISYSYHLFDLKGNV